VQVLAKRGVDIAFVGGSSSVLAAGGFCATGGNIVLWDTLAPISAGPIAFLTHHTPLVTALQVLCCLPPPHNVASAECRDLAPPSLFWSCSGSLAGC
jgi:hypothetical protein